MATLRTKDAPKSNSNGVFIEIVTLGAFAKVTAIESVTGTEVCVTGPSNASRASLEAAAIAKLQFMLKKKKTP